MITTKNHFNGANFDYASENNCTATGEFRYENDKLVNVNINGKYVKDENEYNFWANLEASGNVNISGVPASILSDVAGEVAEIISEIENPNEK